MKVFADLIGLNTLLVALGIGSLGTIGRRTFNAIKLYKEEVDYSREETEKRFRSLEKANRAMLHDKIYSRCNEALAVGWIAVNDLENLDRLFNSYKFLGGNGSGEAIYNKVKKLPNQKPKGDKK